jgi:hypothetical protein
LRAHTAHGARPGPDSRPASLRFIFLYQGLAGGAAPEPEGGTPEGGGGTTLRAVPSPVGSVPGLALVDCGAEMPAVPNPLERPFTAPTFWPARVAGTGTVPLETWAIAAVAVRLSDKRDKASNLMGISFRWKFVSLLFGCAFPRPSAHRQVFALTFVQRT